MEKNTKYTGVEKFISGWLVISFVCIIILIIADSIPGTIGMGFIFLGGCVVGSDDEK